MHRETACLQLRQIEDVADEPLEAHTFARNHVEGCGTRLGILRDSFSKGVDMTADRGQRCAQLVGDAHEEVPLLPLRVGQARSHLPKAVGKVCDLTGATDFGNVDVVAAASNLVRGAREGEHGTSDAP